jgi:two-component system, cell cycle response regulator
MSESEKPPETSTPEGSAPAAPAPPAPEPPEEKTAPHKLRDVAERIAKKRRRALSGSLTMKRPKQPPATIPLDRTQTVLGRDAKCDIVVDDEGVSRRHARIARSEWGYFELVDLGSKNGVLVEGEPIARMTLQDGDTFTVGDTRFTVSIARFEDDV